jgi:hypothetical protein
MLESSACSNGGSRRQKGCHTRVSILSSKYSIIPLYSVDLGVLEELGCNLSIGGIGKG